MDREREARMVSLLNEPARTMACKGLGKLREAGVDYRVLETLRSTATQKAYYAQGRMPLPHVNLLRGQADLPPITEAQNKNTITKCDGINARSAHQDGQALDVVPVHDGKLLWDTTSEYAKEIWLAMAMYLKSAGLKWGGDWGKTASKLGWDCPHFSSDGR